MAMIFRRIGERIEREGEGGAPEHYGPEARAIQARENQARTLALGLLGAHRGGEFARAHLLVGHGPTGAVGAAVARHLWNYGVPFGLSLAGAHERCAPEADRELATLSAMGVAAEEVLSEEQAADLVSSLEPEVRPVLMLAPGEMDGRAREIAGALAAACESRSADSAACDESFRTPAPAEGDAVFSPGYGPRTREDVRLLDSVGVEGFRIPGLVLMENAGSAAAREAFMMLRERGGGEAVVVCGKGNNGGDGFVVARHLAWWDVPVRVCIAGAEEGIFGDARVNLEALSSVAVEPVLLGGGGDANLLREAASGAGLVVDAILGTGLSGEVRGLSREAVEVVNDLGRPVLSLDCPSGLDCNSGEPLGACVRAERTVTFAAAKVGFSRARGPEFTGEVVVADIGLPPAAYGVER